MKPVRDPGLGAALENALPSAVPPRGAKKRVRAALDRRAPRHQATAPFWLVFAGLVACAAVYAARRLDTPHAVRAENAIASLGFARVHLRPGAQFAVERDDDAAAVVRLVSGTALFHVQKGTGRTFHVVAGASRVEVVGTVFAVSFAPPGDVRLEVAEGAVHVRDPSGDRRVAAGESVPAGAALFDDPAELAALRRPVAEIVRAPAVAPPPDTASGADPSPVSSAADSRAERAPRVGGMRPPPDARRADAGVKPAPEPHAPAEPASPYTLAKRLELAGDRETALAAYTTLSREPSPLAEDALFAVIRLQLEKGAPRAALAAAGDYRRRFPAGRYGRDVDVRALDAHLSLGDTAAAEREVDAFLRAHAGDPRAWRFHLARATLRFRAGDCAVALAHLRHVPDGEAKQRISDACAKR